MLHKIAVTLAFIFYASLAVAEPLRLLAFGDSLVQGYGLPQGQGFVPQLQDRLRADGFDIEVVNGGVSGDTTAGGVSRIGWSLSEPFDAIVILLGGNDALRALPPAQARANLGAIVEVAQSKELAILLIGVSAPGNFGTAYKAEFDAIYPDLAAQHQLVLYPNIFAGMLRAVDERGLAMTDLLQADGLHPTAKGVAVNLEALLPVLRSVLSGL